MAIDRHTVEHRPERSVFREDAGASTGRLFPCRRLLMRQLQQGPPASLGTYGRVDGLVDAAAQIRFFHCFVGGILHGLG